MSAGGLPAFGAHLPPNDPSLLAHQILSQARFRMRIARSGHAGWWDAFVGWITRVWHALLGAFAQRLHVGGKTSIVAGDLLLAIVAGLVVLFAVRLLLTYVRAQELSVSETALAPHVAAQTLYGQALQLAEQADYSAAAAMLFRACLAALDLQGIVHDERSRTVNECLAQLRERAPQLTVPFDALARIFTAAIYADTPVTGAQWNAARQAYLQLTQSEQHAA
jgi:Domain of unknown function (DUF4129)